MLLAVLLWNKYISLEVIKALVLNNPSRLGIAINISHEEMNISVHS